MTNWYIINNTRLTNYRTRHYSWKYDKKVIFYFGNFFYVFCIPVNSIIFFLTIFLITLFLHFSWYWIGRKYNNSKSLKNRRVLFFGPSSTIGLELVKELSSRQAELVIASSSPEISEEILQNSFFESNVTVHLIDFSRLHSINEFCEKLIKEGKPIDIFIGSAEIYNQPPELTEDQVDITFQINYLSHFLAILKLSQLIKRSRNGRVIFISSGELKLFLPLFERCNR